MSKLRATVPIVLLLAATCLSGQTPPAKQAPAPPPSPAVQKITDGLYFVEGGSGANTAFYLRSDEVIAVDAKMTPEAAAAMLAGIRKVTSLPLTTLVITHSDGDHINGLPGFPKGLAIVAHENCKADIVAAAETLPALEDYVPNRTYAGPRLALRTGDRPVELAYFGPAHTSGDTVVFFPEEKAVFVGDLLFVGRDPLVHRHKGGNSFGYVKTLEALLDARPEVEIFLSGHAAPLARADVEGLRKAMAEKQAGIKAMIDAGKSLDDVKKAFGIEDSPAAPGGRRRPSLVETIYLELTEKK
jgi:cyclase